MSLASWCKQHQQLRSILCGVRIMARQLSKGIHVSRTLLPSGCTQWKPITIMLCFINSQLSCRFARLRVFVPHIFSSIFKQPPYLHIRGSKGGDNGLQKKNDKQKKTISANMVEVPSYTRLSQYRRSSTPLMLDFRYRAGVQKLRPSPMRTIRIEGQIGT